MDANREQRTQSIMAEINRDKRQTISPSPLLYPADCNAIEADSKVDKSTPFHHFSTECFLTLLTINSKNPGVNMLPIKSHVGCRVILQSTEST